MLNRLSDLSLGINNLKKTPDYSKFFIVPINKIAPVEFS
jgi:hypothetical protein